MRSAVAFENVSKTYTRAYAPSIRDDVSHAARRLARRPSERTIVRALRDVSFSIEQGARFAIMGANGSGKTTALRLMSRVAYPTSGTIRVSSTSARVSIRI